MHKLFPLLLLLLSVVSCQSKRDFIERQAQRSETLPYQSRKYELRAVWMPTVFRSEYAKMSTDEMRRDFVAKLDRLQAIGFNALIFQVRPESDAWYPSRIEPWSRFFTGAQGRAPEVPWDPLAFLIEECHKRGMELHAWVNPYRAATSVTTPLSPLHPYSQHPEWFVRYNNQLLYNPGLPECRAHICRVVHDLVSRYDVDAIHMDDYFYPYPVAGVPFPDYDTYRTYPRGIADIGEWRRDNVSLLIAALRATIDSVKPYVRFGISPFGIYRNVSSHPQGSQTQGLQNYDDLYADILLWDRMRWIDYVMPQLYWEMGHKTADYTELAYWWREHLRYAHYYIGQSVERTMNAGELHPKLVIAHTTSQGVCMWPIEEVLKDFKQVAQQLQTTYWLTPALPPTYEKRRKEPDPPALRRPTIEQKEGHRLLTWEGSIPEPYFKYYVVYAYDSRAPRKDGSSAEDIVAITRNPYYRLPDHNGQLRVTYIVTQVDRYNAESPVSPPLKTTL